METGLGTGGSLDWGLIRGPEIRPPPFCAVAGEEVVSAPLFPTVWLRQAPETRRSEETPGRQPACCCAAPWTAWLLWAAWLALGGLRPWKGFPEYIASLFLDKK